MKNLSKLRYFSDKNISKIVLMMKLLTILLFSVLTTVSASESYSQVVKFSLKLKNATVKEVFEYIEKNSEYILLYNEKWIDVNHQISLDIKDGTLNQLLDQTFIKTKYQYKIYERQVVIAAPIESESPLKKKLEPSQPDTPEKGTGTISGNITDENGLPMAGATIIIENTMKGTITDENGNYRLLGVPAGKHIIKISFVGFTEETREIEILAQDIIVIDAQLIPSSIEIDDVIAYGQARGQLAAINQQLNASGISNIVSVEKLQELPDVNVAEAIGRLPGLMVERDRGEGQKIIIRGLEPKYNTISIGGNIIPSTSTDDRSTDLNMISPDILGGVEVQKANTADKDASGLGGTVNMTLREAPSGFKSNTAILAGYSGHSNNLNNYRGNFYLSHRFYDDRLGVMLTGNGDIAERNSDRFNVNYSVQGVPKYDEGQTFIKPWINSANLQANIENRTRAGGSLLLDWKPNSATKIKSSNFVGFLNRQINDRVKNLDLLQNWINLVQYEDVVNQILNSHSLEGEHFIFGSVLNWGGSFSGSLNKKPYGHRVQFRKLSAFNGYSLGNSFDVEPPELIGNPEYINDQIDQFYFANGAFLTYEAKESESGLFIDWQTPFKIGNSISGYIKTGTKYRQKERSRINTRNNNRIDGSDDVNSFLRVYPDYILTTEGNPGKISILNFLDQNYQSNDFLNNQFEYLEVSEVLDRDIIHKMYDDYLEAYYPFIPAGAKDDYNTDEFIISYYLMSEIKLGKFLTFIPGVRFEKTGIEYRAYIAEELPASESIPVDVQFMDTIASNNYQHLLPQIHLKFKPAEWFDIRLAYTNTLARPDYNQLAPKKLINLADRIITLGNTELNAALSTNYDIILTFYRQKYGLFSLGAFYKEIEGFLWRRSALVIAGTNTDPGVLDVPRSTLGFTVNYPLNNPNLSTIKGIEIDLQSNLDFLPLKGFVLNMNLTLMESETKYSETLVIRTANPDFGVVPGAPRVIFLNQDTAYVDRLLKQPSYLANIGLGYDNMKLGLSLRLSFNYQDDILTSEQRRPDGADREGTLEFYRWDFQVNQRITKRLTFNGNVANIFNQSDRSVRLITGYLRDIEYYGALAQFGFKYNF
jgi:outer membrane receptor protein involved in Fe transport